MTAAVPTASTPALAVGHWPATGAQPCSLPLVLIHGWGSDSRVWDDVLPLLRQDFDVLTLDLPGFGDSQAGTWRLEPVLEQITAALPERCLLVGWSLGGMLATRCAGRHPQRVAGLVTLACNASFVQRDGWRDAMEPQAFEKFTGNFIADPDTTLQRFSALQGRGDQRERAVLLALRQRLPVVDAGQWRAALRLLCELDNRHTLERLMMPSLHLLGEHDSLVPATAAQALRALNPAAEVRVLPGVAHAPQLSMAAGLASLLAAFGRAREEDDYRIDKVEVARSFSRAAATYDQVAHLQRAVGNELLSRLPGRLPGGRVADLGCGTGLFTEQLALRYPGSNPLGIDLAEGMVRHARIHHPGSCQWLCGDAEALPCADHSLGLVFSNFALQWCQDLERLAAELYRVLLPGGALVFSTVGPASLAELRDAWRGVDRYAHVNRFAPLERVRAALESSGFAIAEFSVARRVNHYPQLRDLTRELKGLGAHNVNRGRKGGLTGRRQVDALKAAYERWRTPEGLPATWEVLTVVANRAAS